MTCSIRQIVGLMTTADLGADSPTLLSIIESDEQIFFLSFLRFFLFDAIRIGVRIQEGQRDFEPQFRLQLSVFVCFLCGFRKLCGI